MDTPLDGSPRGIRTGEKAAVTFGRMLVELREGYELNQKQMAEKLGISPQYQHDLERGRRLPSVGYVNLLCVVFARGLNGRKEWHTAAAREHGWQV